MQDIRDTLFEPIANTQFTAEVIVEREGCLSGVALAQQAVLDVGARVDFLKTDGSAVQQNERIACITGTPKQIAVLEERLMGLVCKYSGVATAARQAVQLAGGKARVVSGSWKKMPPQIKEGLRQAVANGGASYRISTSPMLYIDKNYLNMFGSIPAALSAAGRLAGLNISMQVRGITAGIEQETQMALEGGCGILMVDTGNPNDLARCIETANRLHMRDKAEIAYSGNILLEDIPALVHNLGPDILCIGKAIVDAPMIDMKLNVTGRAG